MQSEVGVGIATKCINAAPMRSVVPTARDRAWWRYTQALVDFLATSPRNCWLNSYRFCSKSNSTTAEIRVSPIHGPFALESDALIVLVIASFWSHDMFFKPHFWPQLRC